MPNTEINNVYNATQGPGDVSNQVTMTYNAFGQLAVEVQDHGDGMVGSVLYGYDGGAPGANEIRLNNLRYPNGRILTYSYGTSGGMSDYLNRVDSIVDTSGPLALPSGF